jgi:hypothetical protein
MRESGFVGVHFSNREILKDARSSIQRALYNETDQGWSEALLECEGVTQS